MSIFSRIRNYFTKVVFVGKSELSHPTQCERITYEDPHKQELVVLEILSHNHSLFSRDIDKIYPSGWRRLNDLYHKGLVDNIGNRNRMEYKLNDRGYDFLINNNVSKESNG